MKNNTIDRREFLKVSAILGASLSLGTSPLFALESQPDSKSMPKRTLGKGDRAFEVSALAFGLMGLNYHRSKVLGEKEAANIVAQCVDSGITLFDTAQVYGPNSNEILAGKILKPYLNKVYVTTKFGFGANADVLDSSPKRIKEVCEQSLKRLNLEQIPLFYQHRFDPKTPIEEVAQTIKELIKEGKVARWGVCELSAQTIEKAHKICPLTAVQSEYHLMWRNVESELFPTLEKLGIGFVAYSPLARGYLSGKLTKNSSFDPKNDNRATFPRYQDDTMAANYHIIERLSEFGKGKNPNAKDKNVTPAQIALAYLLAKKPYIIPLFGTTNTEHLRENLGALQVHLSTNDLAQLDKILDKISIQGDRYPPEQAKRVGQ
ncbi:aldo/keto reductase [Helicobacter sp. MIT 05-5293]|uniref:aldo/keto reductase n=1 Tax=Helicobacter sp. MIT 05-5293 TaxID=1548149 RepID=UPI0010FED217|nr:aldo/keto reductase [Helicobacter sp. MIT 05-5293]TLD80907.1 aldo/keto reductase [Helicobacter sp. MIT 05-5293]